MIEISHQQARRLIRAGIDVRPGDWRAISEEQWGILQTHLETCPECCAYQEKIIQTERQIRRLLQGRWSNLPPLKDNLDALVIGARKKRVEQRRLALRVAAGIAIFAVLFLGLRLMNRSSGSNRVASDQRVIASPTPIAGFQGIVAAGCELEGRPRVQLLSSTDGEVHFEPLYQLADEQMPVQERSPAWSPDGEWTAFLAPDESGKEELFVIHVSGTRLTQLTIEPEIDWLGPVSWSPDGEWIALIGARRNFSPESNTWIYLVQVGGDSQQSREARILAYTRGASGPLRFSNRMPLLAYSMPGGRLMVYDMTMNRYTHITALDEHNGLRLADGLFDWSRSNALAYVVESQTDGHVEARIALGLDALSSFSYNPDEPNALLLEAPPGSIHGLTWTPDDLLLILEEGLETGEGCLTLKAHPVPKGTGAVGGATGVPPEIPAVCVDSPVDALSWASGQDGYHWLLFLGRNAPSAERGFYAMRFRESASWASISRPIDSAPLVEYLGSAEDLAGVPAAGSPLRPRPEAQQPRFGEKEIVIRPAAAQAPQQSGLPEAQMREELKELSGTVLVSPPPGIDGPVIRFQIDGSFRRVLTPAKGEHSCAAWSPDGEYIAYLSDQDQPVPHRTEVYRMNSNGSQVTRLTNDPFPGASGYLPDGLPLPHFDCPVWSPDGRYLAAVVYESRESAYLAVIPVKDGDARYLKIDLPSEYTPPVWSPDGSKILLALQGGENYPPRIIAVDWQASTPDDLDYRVVQTFSTTDEVFGMAFSPDATRLAYLAAEYALNTKPMFELHSVWATGHNDQVVYWLSLDEIVPGEGLNRIFWQSNDQIYFLYRSPPESLYKAAVGSYTPSAWQPPLSGYVKEVVYDWYLVDNWFIFSSDSGLWALRLYNMGAEHNQPIRLSDQPVYRIDVR